MVTKKAFDEDESQREISRLKKELQFVKMQMYNSKRQGVKTGGGSKEDFNLPTSHSQYMKQTTATIEQKDQMENDGDDLHLKIDHMDDQSKSMRAAGAPGGMASSYRDELGGMGNKSYLSSEIM